MLVMLATEATVPTGLAANRDMCGNGDHAVHQGHGG